MSDEADLGEAVDFILSERPKLAEDDVWAVLVELQEPPAHGSEGVAITLLGQVRPDVRKRDIKVIIKEWRAYAGLAAEEDWDE